MKGRRNKGGRPRKDDMCKKSIALTIRFTPTQYGIILTRTELANFKSPAEFIAYSALHNTIEQHFLHSDVEFIKDIAGMGSNLNQLTHQANIFGIKSLEDKINELLSEIKEVIQKISRRL